MKAGLLFSPDRGAFTITPAGRELLATNPPRITSTLLEQYPSFISFITAKVGHNIKQGAAPVLSSPTDAEHQTLEERVEAAHEELMSELRSNLLEHVLNQSPAFFEQLIVDLLVAMGYGGNHEDAAQRLGGTGDGGVDGVINEDQLGLDRLYVQAKRYVANNSVGRPDVQSFVGSLVGRGAQKGVFFTTSSFSTHAIEFVRNLTQRIVLIDGTTLADLMIEHGVGVRVSRTITVKKIDIDFFDPE
ncbi:restriction endonuclease [Granulibacter bethesdensis]|nr:restriction endonuclease [Granulibacter bethesdensis]